MPVKAVTGGQGRVRGRRAGAQQGTGSTPSPPAPDPSFGTAAGSSTVSGAGSFLTTLRSAGASSGTATASGVGNTVSPSDPVFAVDFPSISSLPTGVSLSRSTTATYFDSSGALQTAAINTPRFDHDPTTLAAKGLRLEDQRSNLFLQSGSPANQTITVVNGTEYTVSFYGTGTLTLSGAATQTMTGTGATAHTAYTFTASTTSLVIVVSGTVTYPQVEAGPFYSSYIPTTTAAVTRGVDLVTADPLTSYIGPAGSVVAEWQSVAVNGDGAATAFYATGSGNHFIVLRLVSGGARHSFTINTAGTLRGYFLGWLGKWHGNSSRRIVGCFWCIYSI
jgi:hypothetical protein